PRPRELVASPRTGTPNRPGGFFISYANAGPFFTSSALLTPLAAECLISLCRNCEVCIHFLQHCPTRTAIDGPFVKSEVHRCLTPMSRSLLPLSPQVNPTSPLSPPIRSRPRLSAD